MNYPSIFNDVLGPVMRGPSSSHCAASLRIGRICRDLMDEKIENVLIEYDPMGSLATTHKSQGSDMGLFGGFLGYEADDERLVDYQKGIKAAGIQIKIEITDIQEPHPNTYKIHLFNASESHEVVALSLGGGMIEVIRMDGADVSMAGDFCETLIYTSQPDEIADYLTQTIEYDEIFIGRGHKPFVEIKSQTFLPEVIEQELIAMESVEAVKKLNPVLPVMSRKGLTVPFITAEEMLSFNQEKNLSLWELALEYESQRGNISREEVFEKMRNLVRIMQKSIDYGLLGTRFKDRILGPQSMNFQAGMNNKTLIESAVLNQIILYVSAMMEVKSAMGVIIAAPTAGACGALPGAVLGAVSALKLSEDDAIRAMLAAGMIGVFIAAHATFAAEVGGCQAECGSGSGMAAAAIVTLGGGNLNQSLAAASMALQNSLGMICDPVANRVEAPCLGKNIMAASNALSMANLALADYDHLIPLDEVIDAMDKVGKSIAHELRCTGLGGLSATPTARAIEARLEGEEGLNEAALRFKIC
ncbi:MAG: L-serine ammonia-lyase, iron-sulfur-dependent, subunit alpha [Bacteroidetes bacterium]|nr:L-serine ammonia-lyase, iron-sulfur-dependent, subunit alpha [Bacteroidota bacterium]